MEAAVLPVPHDVEALPAALLAATARADRVEAELAGATAKAADDQALIAHLKMLIAKLRREQYGPSAERSRRLIDQLELQLEELEASASEDEPASEAAAAKTSSVAGITSKCPSRQQITEPLPRPTATIHTVCASGQDQGGQFV